MATYNGEKYILEQIKSILPQLGKDDELIVSDDSSSDNTLNIVNSINDSRIKIVINQGQRGYTSNFYNSLSYAKGNYVFLCDQDDVWCPGRVDKMLEKLRDYNFVVCDAREVDANLNTINESRILTYGMKRGFWPNLIRGRYIGCCMAFDKKVLNSIFPVPTYTNSYPHDIWIALIGEFYYRSYLINEPLTLYRRHGDNTSNGGVADKASFLLTIKRIARRFYYLFYVLKQCGHIRKVKKDL